MKRFNSNTVKPSSILTPSCEKQKAFLRRQAGIKSRFAVDLDVKAFDPLKAAQARKPAPLRADFVPAKKRGNNGCRLSPEKRAMVQARAGARHAFFAGLGSAGK
jgi:hypothetical protein